MPDPLRAYTGLLCIGDPHLASRAPGFRKDDYPRNILAKLEWAMNFAETNALLPVILGDLFHYPRDNANWLIVQLLDLFKHPVLAVSGNHDCNENTLTEDDSLSVLSAAGDVHILDHRGPWAAEINGTKVVVGGTSWGQRLPEQFERLTTDPVLVFWIAHHDIRFPGYEESGRLGCKDIPGIDVVINGHIHRPLEDVVCGHTTWLNPGNIARVNRGDSSRSRKPAALRIDIDRGRWSKRVVEIPHQPFDEVFHAELEGEAIQLSESLFIRGLAQLESLKTGGAGLREFLAHNLDQFDEPVAAEVRALAEEVLRDDAVKSF